MSGLFDNILTKLFFIQYIWIRKCKNIVIQIIFRPTCSTELWLLGWPDDAGEEERAAATGAGPPTRGGQGNIQMCQFYVNCSDVYFLKDITCPHGVRTMYTLILVELFKKTRAHYDRTKIKPYFSYVRYRVYLRKVWLDPATDLYIFIRVVGGGGWGLMELHYIYPWQYKWDSLQFLNINRSFIFEGHKKILIL